MSWTLGENDAKHKGICIVSFNGFVPRIIQLGIPQFVGQNT